MDHTKKEPEAIADAPSEAEIRLIPDGPGRWKLDIAVPEGLKIRPGDTISIDNTLLNELKTRSPNGTLLPVKFEADKSSMTKKAAKAK
jgi:invasion protein IalB